MFWEILLGVVMIPIGGVLGAFGLICPLTCLRFGLPFANKIHRHTNADVRRIKKKYWISVLLWLVIDFVVISLVVAFLPRSSMFCFLGGLIVAFLIGIGKTGVNAQNLQDFVESNIKLLPEEDQEPVINYLLELYASYFNLNME